MERGCKRHLNLIHKYWLNGLMINQFNLYKFVFPMDIFIVEIILMDNEQEKVYIYLVMVVNFKEFLKITVVIKEYFIIVMVQFMKEP
jgi:hypothetical protein